VTKKQLQELDVASLRAEMENHLALPYQLSCGLFGLAEPLV
jgi:hypothetical protein